MYFVGVNGCKAGWLAVALTNAGYVSHRVAAEFAEIAQAYTPALILVDIPIGLRDEGETERLCDTAARKVLGRPRASSVFPAPCRSAMAEGDYPAASAENRRKTGRRLSQQSWAIVPRIRQVDEYLRRHSGDGPVVREVHPEVCFWGLAGVPMQHPKHRPDGQAERLKELAGVFGQVEPVVREIAQAHPRAVLADDDVLDALVAAVTGLVGGDNLMTLPQLPERDSHGLRMEMVCAAARSCAAQPGIICD